jgi:putative methionine-R-sulfoxide reductase with GAF domain
MGLACIIEAAFDMSSQEPQAVPVQPVPPPNERRGRTRHPISVPATVRLRGPGIGATFTQLLDFSEDGIGVQTSVALQPDRTLALDLDLRTDPLSEATPESSGQHRIRLIGQVAWSQPDGRAGVRFFSPDHAALHAIQQWLFLNAVAGAAGSSRLPDLLALATPLADASAASGPVNDVKQERFVDEEDDIEHSLSPLDRDINAIVSRALALTGAKGAALALYEGDQLICRATCGTDTPGLGARISTDSGITGECIRFAQVMYCSDAAADRRVDHEICADLGIRSILALPLFAAQRVVGLLEVLSQRAEAFDPVDAEALDLMARPIIGLLFAEGASESLHRGVRDVTGTATMELSSQELDVAAMERRRQALARSLTPRNRFFRRAIEAVAALTVIGAVTWLIFSQGKTLASLRQLSAVATNQIPAEVPHLSASPAETAAMVVGSRGTKPNPAELLDDGKTESSSFEELKAAAQDGEPSAQYAMGARYATGEGVPQDYATAARWFTQAAKKGYAPAQGMLGAYYWSGRGLRKDLKQAYFWSVLARDGNDEISKDRVDSLVAQLNRDEMLQVQQLVRDWYRKHSPSSPETAAATVTR